MRTSAALFSILTLLLIAAGCTSDSEKGETSLTTTDTGTTDAKSGGVTDEGPGGTTEDEGETPSGDEDVEEQTDTGSTVATDEGPGVPEGPQCPFDEPSKDVDCDTICEKVRQCDSEEAEEECLRGCTSAALIMDAALLTKVEECITDTACEDVPEPEGENDDDGGLPGYCMGKVMMEAGVSEEAKRVCSDFAQSIIAGCGAPEEEL